jgi:hypothetical protein
MLQVGEMMGERKQESCLMTVSFQRDLSARTKGRVVSPN